MYSESRISSVGRLESMIEKRKEELLDLLGRWNYMHNIVKPGILFVYESIFGDLEIEIESKWHKAGELEKRRKMIADRISSGERLTEQSLGFIDRVIKKETERLTDREETDIFDRFESFSFGETVTEKPRDTVNLYRTIVKKLHPDIAGDSEQFKKYWDSVQFAYRSGNKRHLELFKTALCNDYSQSHWRNEYEKEYQLKRELQNIESGIEKEKQKLNDLTATEPFVFERYLDDLSWIQRRKRRMREKIIQIERRIEFNSRMIDKMTSDFKKAQESKYAYNGRVYSR